MPEEMSPESKLFVKEEIEKIRKDIKEEVEKVKSKTTKIFTTVVVVVGLLTGLGVYGSAKHYINTTVEAKIGTATLAEIENNKIQARNSYKKIVEYKQEANAILASQSDKILIGTIVPYGGKIESTSEDPCQVQPGWFFCNGASLNCEEYKDLFDVIGWAFGKPDDSTFNLPDLRGRFVRGVDHGAGNDPDVGQREAGGKRKNGNKGDKVGSYQLDNIQKHIHQWAESQYEGDQDTTTDLYSWDKNSIRVRALDRIRDNQLPGGKDTGKDDDLMEVVPGSFWTNPKTCVGIPETKTETRPKNVYVNWIIKARQR